MIMRERKSLFWQYINWREVTKYIDSLKSRNYQKFITGIKIRNIEICGPLLISPITILLALRKELSLELNEFELGYLLFCFSNVIKLDKSFFFTIEIRNLQI